MSNDNLADVSFHPHRAKELEHYQRVRSTCEGPPTTTTTNTNTKPPDRARLAIRNSSTTKPSDGGNHLNPPPPSTTTATSRKQPKAPIRRNTARKDEPKGNAKGKGKGKGKATTWDSDDEDEDEVYLTSNDTIGTPERRANGVFGNGTVEGEDEEMYR